LRFFKASFHPTFRNVWWQFTVVMLYHILRYLNGLVVLKVNNDDSRYGRLVIDIMLEYVIFPWTDFSPIGLITYIIMHCEFIMQTVSAIYPGTIRLSSIIKLEASKSFKSNVFRILIFINVWQFKFTATIPFRRCSVRQRISHHKLSLYIRKYQMRHGLPEQEISSPNDAQKFWFSVSVYTVVSNVFLYFHIYA